MVGGHQDPTGVLQVNLVEQHLGKWLMGEEERSVGGGRGKERWKCNEHRFKGEGIKLQGQHIYT